MVASGKRLGAALLLLSTSTLAAPAGDGSQADAERMLQAYLAMWSGDGRITAATVDRFYAPRVSYYGHDFTRAEVLADKRAFVLAYPTRTYREVPGSFAGTCNEGRSRCHVTATVAFRRVDRRGGVTAGRVRLGFEFVPAEGGRKIARESAQPLGPS